VIRSKLPRERWADFAHSLAGGVQHMVLHQDPLTGRAYRKPRGFAGDAVMLDLMYGSASIVEDTSAIGATVYSGTSSSSASDSVRMRRNFLANYLDDLCGFDVIYSAGLYDYLDASLATALTRALFSTLNSRGRLLVANFAPEVTDAGYMEAIMDWWLVYRDEAALRSLTTGIPTDEVSSARTWRDATGNIVYLEVRRR